jgi:hypothetical protein
LPDDRIYQTWKVLKEKDVALGPIKQENEILFARQLERVVSESKTVMYTAEIASRDD